MIMKKKCEQAHKNRYMNVNKRKRRKGPKKPIVKAEKIKKKLKSI